ncbi:MAG: magnesium/cobalt transporter CorA [Treponema sp.]|jgi:magnesium transporter|nr:magnesium/cobalt transporter CorA [Treponema sp.]
MAVERPDLGLPPGSLVYVGDQKPTETSLSIIGYDPIGSWTKTAATVEELLSYRNDAGITWINVNGLDDTDSISKLAKTYGLHNLSIEDILNTEHRPKVEAFEDYLFIIAKAITWNEEQGPEYEQISIVLTNNTVITFQEHPGDCFDAIRKRIEVNAGRIRKMGSDYLAYAILDSMVDEYFKTLDKLGQRLEEYETQAVDETGRDFLKQLQFVKQQVLGLRRIIWPLRESISTLQRLDTEYITEELTPFLKDLYDNILQCAETIESYRELIVSIMEVNLSSVSNRMNEVMKVLTIISTIFIPLTFVVGVYGMNFKYMPELEHPLGYPVTWGVMALIALGMIAFFKRRHWL